MQLRKITLDTFRNLDRTTIHPSPGINVFVGDNGQGKTNLLEAIYILGALKSFRNHLNRDIICTGEQQARVFGEVSSGPQVREVEVRLNQRGRQVYLNGQPVNRLSDFYGSFISVVFTPMDVALLHGNPGDRRRYLDRTLFFARPVYADVYAEYTKALKQRNALLKERASDPLVLSVYEETLAHAGAAIVADRLELIDILRPLFTETFRQIFGREYHCELSYECDWLKGELDDATRDELVARLQQLLTETLLENRHGDRMRGFTQVGPHRDDIGTTLNDLPVRIHASQGQHRALVLSLKIATIQYLHDITGHQPVLLLDDVSSELDRQRNQFLFEYLEQIRGQVFITTTHRDNVRLAECEVFMVQTGTIVGNSVKFRDEDV